MFHALRLVVLSVSGHDYLPPLPTSFVGEDDILTKPGEVVWEGGLMFLIYIYIYIYTYEKWTAELKNNSDGKCSSVHSKCIKGEPLNEILCMTILPAFSQFLWNLKSIFSCSHENLFFEVISYKLITFIALGKCRA